jgi:ABC-type branched-subunit amino acid transport system substrate-binding protein
VLLIANSGSVNSYVPAIAGQIVQANQSNASIIGVMGWPFSSYTSQAYKILEAAKIPMVSNTASSDLLTDVSPYFFRVCPTNVEQGADGAKYAEQKLAATKVIVLQDPLDAYSGSLANDFATQFKADGGTVLANEDYTVGKADTVVAALQKALSNTNPAPNLLYFSGYAADINSVLANLPTSGQFANLPIMGGDALNELSSYQEKYATAFGRLHYTAFSHPDTWDTLGLSAQKPAFYTDYSNDFDPNHQYKPDATYGFTRADSDVVTTFDAVSALLVAAKHTGKSTITTALEEQALQQLHGTNAFQGASGQIAFGTNGDPINKAVVILNIVAPGYIVLDNTVEGQFLL